MEFLKRNNEQLNLSHQVRILLPSVSMLIALAGGCTYESQTLESLLGKCEEGETKPYRVEKDGTFTCIKVHCNSEEDQKNDDGAVCVSFGNMDMDADAGSDMNDMPVDMDADAGSDMTDMPLDMGVDMNDMADMPVDMDADAGSDMTDMPLDMGADMNDMPLDMGVDMNDMADMPVDMDADAGSDMTDMPVDMDPCSGLDYEIRDKVVPLMNQVVPSFMDSPVQGDQYGGGAHKFVWPTGFNCPTVSGYENGQINGVNVTFLQATSPNGTDECRMYNEFSLGAPGNRNLDYSISSINDSNSGIFEFYGPHPLPTAQQKPYSVPDLNLQTHKIEINGNNVSYTDSQGTLTNQVCDKVSMEIKALLP
jgi:hypothetical protein